MDNFQNKEILDNSNWNKQIGYIDSFYVNSALVTCYNKRGAEFINIRKSIKNMYEDIYNNKIKLPESIDDSWTTTTLSRYMEKEINEFNNTKSPNGQITKDKVINEIINCLRQSKIFINYEGLNIEVKLNSMEGIHYKCELVTTIRGKISSGLNLCGKEINFSGITISSKNLKRHEILTFQIFLDIIYATKNIKIIVSKFGDNIEKLIIDNGEVFQEFSFNECGIKWGSFDINRGV